MQGIIINMAEEKNGKYIHYPTEVKDYARDLYLTGNDSGGHLYSYQDIADKVKEEFPDLPSFPDQSTIGRWSNGKSATGKTWKQLWAEGTIKGVLQSQEDLKKLNETRSAEEVLEERVTAAQRTLRLIGVDLTVKGYKPFKKKDYTPPDEDTGLRMIDRGLKILAVQNKEMEMSEDKVVNIIFKTTDRQPLHVKNVDSDIKDTLNDVLDEIDEDTAE